MAQEKARKERIARAEALNETAERGKIKAQRATRTVKNSDLPNGLPIKGASNEIVDKSDDFGNTLQRRIYSDDGRAAVDYDTSDHNQPTGHPTGAHKHRFDYKNKRLRGKNEPLTAEELAENADIIQKGVNYHDESGID